MKTRRRSARTRAASVVLPLRDVVDEDVAAGQQGHGDELDGVPPPTDHALDVVDHRQRDALRAAGLEVVRACVDASR